MLLSNKNNNTDAAWPQFTVNAALSLFFVLFCSQNYNLLIHKKCVESYSDNYGVRA